MANKQLQMQDNSKFLMHENSGAITLNGSRNGFENLPDPFLKTNNDFRTASFLNYIVGYSN